MMTETELKLAGGVRRWLAIWGVSGGIPEADRRVVYADQDMTRVQLPYLTVRVLVYDLPQHEAESWAGEDEDDPDVAVWRSRTAKTSTVTVNAWGAGASAWVERAVGLLGAPPVVAQLELDGISIRELGGADNISALLDDTTEVRWVRDFAVDYTSEHSLTGPGVVPLEQAVHTDTWEGSDSNRVEIVTEEF